MAVALQTRSPQVATWWEEALRLKLVSQLACPSWLSIAALPQIDREYSLTESQVLSLLAGLKSGVHPLLVALRERVSVGLVHPAHLSEGERALWGEILNDYEIFQPFRQLNRTVFGLEAGELVEILRFGKIDVPNNVVLTILKKGGWSYREKGRRILHCKSIAYAVVTAVVQHSQTVYAGYDSGTSRMERCWFVAGDRLSAAEIAPERALLLGEVDPMAVSEVLRTLGAIAAKGEE
jgi:Domain of unknown function (DUF4132)